MTLSREAYLTRWGQLHGGYDPGRSWLVSGWLHVSYALARPVVTARVPPDAVSLAAVVVATAAVLACAHGGRWVVAGALLVGLCGVLDGLDGAVAVVSGRASGWGAVLDSVVDRFVDALLLLALWVVGAPPLLCLVAGVLGFAGEYARARAGGLGVTQVAVVTVGERPARVAVVGMFLLAAGVLPHAAQPWAVAAAGLLVLLAVGSLAQLVPVLRHHLTTPGAPTDHPS